MESNTQCRPGSGDIGNPQVRPGDRRHNHSGPRHYWATTLSHPSDIAAGGAIVFVALVVYTISMLVDFVN